MNEFEKTKEFLDDLEINYEVIENNEYNNKWYKQEVIIIELWAQQTNKVDGYNGDGMEIIFNKEKKLIKILILGD